MKSIVRAGILTLAGSVGIGLASTGMASAITTPDQKDLVLSKRELSSVVLAVEDDDDRDDSRDNTGNTGNNTNNNSRNSGTGNSNDGTGSRHTGVSRDRDHSRGDLTKDWTRDGGNGLTRDFSRFLTNDGSRNDTRGRR